MPWRSAVRDARPKVGGPALLLCLILAPAVGAHPGIDQQIADLTVRIESDPTDATLYMRRGELHRLHREWAAAEADYRRARKLDPDLAAVDLCEGTMKLDAGRPKAAKKILDRFLDRQPDHAAGLAARARALVLLGRPLAAADDFTRALANSAGSPQGPDYYLERARALEAAGEPHLDRAIRGLDEGIAALGHPITLELLAVDLELELGRHDAALRRIDGIAARSARKESWLVRRGEILEMASRPEQALEAYGKALQAIELLPAGRRHNRAVERLEQQARSAIERLRAP